VVERMLSRVPVIAKLNRSRKKKKNFVSGKERKKSQNKNLMSMKRMKTRWIK
jgi:hypothetical protein